MIARMPENEKPRRRRQSEAVVQQSCDVIRNRAPCVHQEAVRLHKEHTAANADVASVAVSERASSEYRFFAAKP
jgi:dihydroneopterin aldolase